MTLSDSTGPIPEMVRAMVQFKGKQGTLAFQATKGKEWINTYVKEAKILESIQSKFPLISISTLDKKLVITGYEDAYPIRKEVEAQICSIQQIQLSEQGLSQQEFQDYFTSNDQINRLVQNFTHYSFVNSKVVLFYTTTRMRPEKATKRAYEIQGFRKETLVLECRDLPTFVHYKQDQLCIILKELVKEHREEFKNLSDGVRTLGVLVVEGTKLAFTVIGLKKHFINLFDNLIELLQEIKSAVRFYSPKNQGESEQFKKLLDKQTVESEARGVTCRYSESYIVILGDDTIPDDLVLFITSSKYQLKIDFRKDVEFILDNIEELRKNIERRVRYFNFDQESLVFWADPANYAECVKIVKQFIFEKKEQEEVFHFDTEAHKHTFMKYFQSKVPVQTQHAGTTGVKYLVTKPNIQFLNQELKKTNDQISSSMKRILVPKDQIIQSQLLTCLQKVHIVPNHSRCNVFSDKQLTVQISQRVQEEEVDCLLGCFDTDKCLFLDSFVKPLLQPNIINSIVKPQKKSVGSLHRISLDFCPNVVLHRFAYLERNKVFKDLDVIFQQVKNGITNLTLVVPEKYKYWWEYVQDFYLNFQKHFRNSNTFKRLVIVCKKESVNQLKSILKSENKQKQILSNHKLIKHRCLPFYNFKSTITEKYRVTPLLLCIIDQHRQSGSSNVIITIPRRSDILLKEYIANLDAQTVTDTQTKQIHSFRDFVNQYKLVNQLLKRNFRNHKSKFKSLVFYVADFTLVGDSFQFSSNDQLLRKLGDGLTHSPVDETHQYNLERVEELDCKILQGYTQQVDLLARQLICLDNPDSTT